MPEGQPGSTTGMTASLLVSGRAFPDAQSPTSVNPLDQTQTRNWKHQVAALERQLAAAQQQLSFQKRELRMQAEEEKRQMQRDHQQQL